MRIRMLAIAATVAWLPTQAAVAGTDPLCAPLRAFVRSVKPDDTRSFDFHTLWGGNFKDEAEPAIYAKRCNHAGYEPANRVCEYLMEHGATEFSDNNLERAVTCLSRKTRFAPGLSFSETGISFSYGTDDRGAMVKVRYGQDDQIGGMVLTVTAEGY
jgi:hypothetical protein